MYNIINKNYTYVNGVITHLDTIINNSTIIEEDFDEQGRLIHCKHSTGGEVWYRYEPEFDHRTIINNIIVKDWNN